MSRCSPAAMAAASPGSRSASSSLTGSSAMTTTERRHNASPILHRDGKSSLRNALRRREANIAQRRVASAACERNISGLPRCRSSCGRTSPSPWCAASSCRGWSRSRRPSRSSPRASPVPEVSVLMLPPFKRVYKRLHNRQKVAVGGGSCRHRVQARDRGGQARRSRRCLRVQVRLRRPGIPVGLRMGPGTAHPAGPWGTRELLPRPQAETLVHLRASYGNIKQPEARPSGREAPETWRVWSAGF